MSIINDALKKTQLSFKKKDKEPEKKPEPQVPAAEQTTSNVYEKFHKQQAEKRDMAIKGGGPAGKKIEKETTPLRSAKKWLKIAATFIICAGIVWGAFAYASRFEPVQDFLRSVKRTLAPAGKAISRKSPAPKRRTYRPGDLVLNGTSLIDGKRVALINDEIYEVGEVIDGKTITSINLNQIELTDDEKIITLRVH